MTSMVTQLVSGRLPANPSAALGSPIDLLITGFIIAVLTLRLLNRAAQDPGARWRLHPLDLAAIPLVLAFGAVALGRILEIFPLG